MTALFYLRYLFPNRIFFPCSCEANHKNRNVWVWSKSSFISFLIVLFGHIALHRYKRQDITPNARLRWCSVKFECIHSFLWWLIFVGFLENILYHILEWWAMIFRKTEIASNQLESSRAEYKPNSFAILDFNGDWFNRFLYILDRVPNVAVSKSSTRQD